MRRQPSSPTGPNPSSTTVCGRCTLPCFRSRQVRLGGPYGEDPGFHLLVPVSIDEVAAKAHVAKQTVYAHFSNKRELFVAMVSTLTNEASDRVHVGVPEFREGDDLKGYLTDYAVRHVLLTRAGW